MLYKTKETVFIQTTLNKAIHILLSLLMNKHKHVNPICNPIYLCSYIKTITSFSKQKTNQLQSQQGDSYGVFHLNFTLQTH